jgi:hypothetical protein
VIVQWLIMVLGRSGNKWEGICLFCIFNGALQNILGSLSADQTAALEHQKLWRGQRRSAMNSIKLADSMVNRP